MARLKLKDLILSIMASAAVAVLPTQAEGRVYKRVPPVEGMESRGFTTYDITGTADGFMWFATDRGLIRFDGEHSVMISLPAQKPAEDPTVKALVPDIGGGLIAAASSGIYRIDTDNCRYVVTQLLNGVAFPATCAVSIPNKISLIGGDEGIVAFTPDGKSRRLTVSRDVLDLSNKVIDMAAGKDGVYLLTKGGVYRLDTGSLNAERIGDASITGTLNGTSIAAADGCVYIGTSGNGIWRMDLPAGNVREAFGFSRGNVVTSMKLNRDGSMLYVGTDGGGITKIDLADERIAASVRHMASNPVGPSSNQVYCLYAGKGDNLWAGYYQNGVDYTPSWTGPFELIDDSAVFNTRDVPVRALSISGDRITIGTREGITVFENNCSVAWSITDHSLRSGMVISLLDHDGKTYIGTYGGGLQILDPRSRRVCDTRLESEHPVFHSGHVFSLAADRSGNLWAGTNHGLFRQSADGAVRRYTSSDSGLPEGNVYGIFFDSEGKGWICTDSGLCVYDPRTDKLRTDLFTASFPRKTRFRTVYEDSRHRLYFVPENGMVISSGLDLSDQKTFSHHLLDNADAKGVVEDSKGNIWIATNKGVFRVDSQYRVVRFGLASGLPSPLFLQGQPAGDGKGHIWFGNSAGLLRLTESEIDSSIDARRAPVPTVLKVNGSLVDFVPQRGADGSYRISVNKSSNTVRIGFSTFSYTQEEPDAYVYSLDGGEWCSFANELSLTFYELSPGMHVVRVKSANDPEGTAEETSVKIHVPYPVWWHVLIGLILALVIVPALIWMNIARRMRKNAAAESASAAEDKVNTATEDAPRHKYASNTLTRTEAREIARKVADIMENDKPYLQPDLKVADLAAMAGISSHKMSQFFSQHKGHTFYDHINKYRVEEFKRLVKDERNRSLTLSAMAEKAGFSSRASFFRHFKSIEGISPGEYLKSNGEGDQ